MGILLIFNLGTLDLPCQGIFITILGLHYKKQTLWCSC